MCFYFFFENSSLSNDIFYIHNLRLTTQSASYCFHSRATTHFAESAFPGVGLHLKNTIFSNQLRLFYVQKYYKTDYFFYLLYHHIALNKLQVSYPLMNDEPEKKLCS